MGMENNVLFCFYIRNSKVESYELRLGNEESKKANLDNLAKLADINKWIENFDIKIESLTVSLFKFSSFTYN